MSNKICEMPLGPVDYSGGAPDAYHCTLCGMSGVKLWREYSTFLNHQCLYCLECACKDEERDDVRPSEDGRSLVQLQRFGHKDVEFTCDQIGGLVPAVPTEEGDTFWGYTSAPPPGCAWWWRLPYVKKNEISDEELLRLAMEDVVKNLRLLHPDKTLRDAFKSTRYSLTSTKNHDPSKVWGKR